jgi:hypothetical protein
MRRVVLALLALALPMAALASSTDPITIDFGVGRGGGTEGSYTGHTLNTSTAFNFGSGPFIVLSVGADDESGLTPFVSHVDIVPTDFVYGSGDSGSITPFTKSWTSPRGTFSETFTSFTANRSAHNAITIDLSGILTGNNVTHRNSGGCDPHSGAGHAWPSGNGLDQSRWSGETQAQGLDISLDVPTKY